jgi:misacylated tRNA(Ala) deacylase
MNRYASEPRLFALETAITDVQQRPGGGCAVACRDTIFRPGGGGQPDDHGFLDIDGAAYRVSGMHKEKGSTYLHVDGLAAPPNTGAPVVQRIDGERRERLSRLHTLQHLFSAETPRIVPGAVPDGTGLRDDASGAWLRFRRAGGIDDDALLAVEEFVRSHGLARLDVTAANAKSVADAEARHGRIFRLDPAVTLTGKVRLVVIAGVDANCCSGTHWDSTDVGRYAMTICRSDEADAVELRLAFAEG